MSAQSGMRTPTQFLAAVRGIPAVHVANALNTFTPGIVWNGCSKALMAERWAASITAGHRDDHALSAAPLELVRARAIARSKRVVDWEKAAGGEDTKAAELVTALHRIIDNCGPSVTEQHIANLIRVAIAKATGNAK